MISLSNFGKKSHIINGSAFSNMKPKLLLIRLNFALGNMVFILLLVLQMVLSMFCRILREIGKAINLMLMIVGSQVCLGDHQANLLCSYLRTTIIRTKYQWQKNLTLLFQKDLWLAVWITKWRYGRKIQQPTNLASSVSLKLVLINKHTRTGSDLFHGAKMLASWKTS